MRRTRSAWGAQLQAAPFSVVCVCVGGCASVWRGRRGSCLFAFLVRHTGGSQYTAHAYFYRYCCCATAPPVRQHVAQYDALLMGTNKMICSLLFVYTSQLPSLKCRCRVEGQRPVAVDGVTKRETPGKPRPRSYGSDCNHQPGAPPRVTALPRWLAPLWVVETYSLSITTSPPRPPPRNGVES